MENNKAMLERQSQASKQAACRSGGQSRTGGLNAFYHRSSCTRESCPGCCGTRSGCLGEGLGFSRAFRDTSGLTVLQAALGQVPWTAPR